MGNNGLLSQSPTDKSGLYMNNAETDEIGQ